MKSIVLRMLILLSFASWIVSPHALAEIIELQADSTGWVDHRGYGTGEQNPLTSTGKSYISGTPYIRNSYYVFDLSSVYGNIESAALHLSLAHFRSQDVTESFSVYDVSTEHSRLTANHSSTNGGSFAPDIFDDLQSGNLFANGITSASAVGSNLIIDLSSFALADLMLNRGGAIAFGLTATDVLGEYSQDFGFNSSFNSGHQTLVITASTVPIPSAAFLFGSTLLALAAIRRT